MYRSKLYNALSTCFTFLSNKLECFFTSKHLDCSSLPREGRFQPCQEFQTSADGEYIYKHPSLLHQSVNWTEKKTFFQLKFNISLTVTYPTDYLDICALSSSLHQRYCGKISWIVLSCTTFPMFSGQPGAYPESPCAPLSVWLLQLLEFAQNPHLGQTLQLTSSFDQFVFKY